MLAVESRRQDTFSEQAVAGPSSKPILAPIPRCPTSHSLRSTAGTEGRSGASSPSTIRRPPSRTEKNFVCGYPGCNKAYYKPSRLAEHELTHTGLRPHQCPHCDQAYLRASHLTAHLRTHLSEEEKPFGCPRLDCEKRFWTATHLKRHEKVHDQVQSYQCLQCSESFTKAHSLREHVTMSHLPEGTKLFQCTHKPCECSFSTKQQLRAHEKTHDPTRYTCSHPSHGHVIPAFPTWSALQSHMHEVHPPTCPHPECNGRVFKTAQRLKDHLKVHSDRRSDIEALMHLDNSEVLLDSEDEAETSFGLEADQKESRRSRKRRQSEVHLVSEQRTPKLRRLSFGEAGKQFSCEEEGCQKRFKTKFALASHMAARHLDLRHNCPREGCGKSFAHKSNLRRHLAGHNRPTSPPAEAKMPRVEDTKSLLTGQRKKEMRHACPIGSIVPEAACKGRFNRVYDIRRHLIRDHEIELDDAEIRALLAICERNEEE